MNDLGDVYYPAEWMTQSGIILTWPEEGTDWAPSLNVITECYFSLAKEIALREKLIIICKSKKKLQNAFTGDVIKNIIFLELNYNDTWIRDYGPITIFKNKKPVLLDFRFNGWGMKFPSNSDNQVNKQLYKTDIFRDDVNLINRKDLVLEGGSVETDGNGTLLVTQKCLLSVNRNEHLSKIELEEELKQTFGTDRVLWLKHGYLSGDDTDGHIDTLVRFCDPDTLMYVRCEDRDDEHFSELSKMEEELMQVKKPNGNNYQLVPVPLPKPVFDLNGNKLPATYLNFLFVNGAVLVPVYDNEMDQQALEIFQQAFKNREIVPVKSLPLLNQGGSLHCATMQLPEGCL